jgi:hypothetical protein
LVDIVWIIGIFVILAFFTLGWLYVGWFEHKVYNLNIQWLICIFPSNYFITISGWGNLFSG